ncbi:MAG: hypothetical protein ABH827_01595 [bacterium]
MKKFTLLSIAILIGLVSSTNNTFTMKMPNELCKQLEELHNLSQSIKNNQKEITDLNIYNETNKIEATPEEEKTICDKNTEITTQKNNFLTTAQNIIILIQDFSPIKTKELDSLTKEIKQLTGDSLPDKKIAEVLKKLGKSYESLANKKSSNCFITFKVMLIISFVIMVTAIIIARIQNIDINNLWDNLTKNKNIEQCVRMVNNFLNKTAEMIIKKASISRDHLCLNYGKFCD